ncbi:DNA repair protein RecN [Candidatus Sumerlaeota bacterium]|nr:DNA repair protein RecN [Candidatus Sumerlaeota bacterium]
MLVRLRIKNLAIIDDLTLDLSDGFTVLTGETGAGKSIILGALNLVLGERASAEDVRSGCDSAEVEALFDLSGSPQVRELLGEMGPSDASETAELVVRREVSAQGRSRCLANGRLATLAQVRTIGDLLVDLHGQHQHQSLLRVELHREILDDFAGDSIAPDLNAYRALFDRYGEAMRRLRALDRDEREIERQKGILEFQVDEIRKASLEPGEDERLEEERRRLEHAESLGRSTLGATDLLYEGETQETTAADLFGQAKNLVAEAARLDPSLEPELRRLESLHSELQDVARSLRSYADSLEHDPERLAEVEDRVHLIRSLKRKYGASIEEILAEGARFAEELHALTHGREEQERLETERAELEKKMVRAAESLSAGRREAADKFSRALSRHLKDLEMPSVRFEVRLDREEAARSAGVDEVDGVDGVDEVDRVDRIKRSPRSTASTLSTSSTPSTVSAAGGAHAIPFPGGATYRVHEWGVDQVEFLISPNPGEELKALRRIASGGELSRIMLALKALMSAQDQVPTLVFDEIDTGISGKTGTRVGEKMAALGERRQVVCITHLPQIAARAASHFAVRKVREKGRTLTRVERLDPKDRVGEIARLLGGQEESALALRHARELLAQS